MADNHVHGSRSAISVLYLETYIEQGLSLRNLIYLADFLPEAAKQHRLV